MEGKRIAIACQGGGSQCAFVAGALKTLFERQVHRRCRIVGLSGTSGGALTAAIAWLGLLKEARGDRTPIGDRIVDCWRDITAQTPVEMAMDQFCVQLLRLTEGGVLPSLATSPSSQRFRFWTNLASRLTSRPEFTDLRALMLKHLDFEELPSLMTPDSPALLVGAGDVLEGTFKVFSSTKGEVSVDALLASAAIPTLFPAVWVGGHAYWDGIFAANPPVAHFLRQAVMGAHRIPEEIWIILVNRPQHSSVPESPSEIFDVRNHLAGNLSLRHELEKVELMNYLLAEDALTPAFRARFGFDARNQITVRFIRMSPTLQAGLDYPSKLSRQPLHITRLIADGQAQAAAFLDDWEQARERPAPEITVPMEVR